MSFMLDMEAVEKTDSAIRARIAKRPSFQVVPAAAMATIESVISASEDEAWDRWPTASAEHQKCRIHFWKLRLLEAVGEDADTNDSPAAAAGLWAVYYHEYTAAIQRSAARIASGEDEADDEYTPMCASPDIAQRALADAYASTAAALDNFVATPIWA